MDNKKWAHLSVLFANIIYGANYSIAKLVMPDFIGPSAFIVLRVGISAMLFLMVERLFVKETIKTKDHVLIIACAIFGVAANQLMFFKGLSLTSPINSGLIMVTNPIFVLLISTIVLKDALSTQRIIGVLLALSGAVLLIYRSNLDINSESNSLGDVFILLNSLSYAIYLVMVKPLMKKYHPITIMRYMFLYGFIFVLPFGYIGLTEINWKLFTVEIWQATAFVIIGTTFFAYLFNTLALKELSASDVSVYIYLQPIMAAMFAICLGHQSPNFTHLVSAVLVFVGVYLVGNSKKSNLNPNN